MCKNTHTAAQKSVKSHLCRSRKRDRDTGIQPPGHTQLHHPHSCAGLTFEMGGAPGQGSLLSCSQAQCYGLVACKWHPGLVPTAPALHHKLLRNRFHWG